VIWLSAASWWACGEGSFSPRLRQRRETVENPFGTITSFPDLRQFDLALRRIDPHPAAAFVDPLRNVVNHKC